MTTVLNKSKRNLKLDTTSLNHEYEKKSKQEKKELEEKLKSLPYNEHEVKNENKDMGRLTKKLVELYKFLWSIINSLSASRFPTEILNESNQVNVGIIMIFVGLMFLLVNSFY